jgi:hypothetical protein
MTDTEYRQLYNLIRRYQLEQTTIGGKTYNACDTLLRELFPHYYNQNKEQQR